MIPGDIDLTQNLDFRNSRKKEIPQLPELWDGNGRITANDPNYLTYITSSTPSIRVRITDDNDLETSQTYTIRHQYNSNYTWTSMITYNDNNSIYLYTDDDWGTTSININTTINTINSYFAPIESTTYNFDENITISFEDDDESKYDIFGNKIVKQQENIPKIPWGEKSNYRIRPIPWSVFDYQEDEYIPDIPWDIERKKHSSYIRIMDFIDRAEHLISWFNGKSEHFIRTHLETDEDVDLSYLTNMNWIRVKDAIID